MSRRDNASKRCQRCKLHGNLCLCAELPTLHTRTRLLLVVHRREARKTTNTGLLAVACLANAEAIVRGHEDRPDGPLPIPEGTRPVLLFPHEEAPPLDALPPDPRPTTLIVPDGTWRQASKVRQRVPGLAAVACARLPAGPPSVYRLRTEPHEGGLATCEAIARALGVLEGDEIRRALERPFLAMVERTLWARGLLPAEQVTGGVPEEARRRGPGIAAESWTRVQVPK